MKPIYIIYLGIYLAQIGPHRNKTICVKLRECLLACLLNIWWYTLHSCMFKFEFKNHFKQCITNLGKWKGIRNGKKPHGHLLSLYPFQPAAAHPLPLLFPPALGRPALRPAQLVPALPLPSLPIADGRGPRVAVVYLQMTGIPCRGARLDHAIGATPHSTSVPNGYAWGRSCEASQPHRCSSPPHSISLWRLRHAAPWPLLAVPPWEAAKLSQPRTDKVALWQTA